MATCKTCQKNVDDVVKINKCGHNVCYECLCNYLDNFTSAKINCPVNGCTKTVQDSLIRKCLSNEKLALYDVLCFAPNTVKCLVKGCQYFVAYDENDTNFKCQICKQPNCLKCKQLHEENTECPSKKNYNATKFENAAYDYLQKYRKEALIIDSNNNDLIPNSDRFECDICCGLILPREGVSLRNCMDNICRSCLDNNVSQVENLKSLSCPRQECCRPFTERECQALIGKEKFKKLCLDIVKPSMYNCQTPECKGMWDFASYVGMHKCCVCHKYNCSSCEDVHEGMTCENFRKTARFIHAQKFREDLEKRISTTCQKCKVVIIKSTGCNALRCPTCRLQVCAYSGLEVGRNGCKCTNSKRCVPGCHPGCIPEGNTPYEKDLAEYFWNN